MIKAYKILSLLLSYPSEELQQFLRDAEDELKREALLKEEILKEISVFVQHFQKMDIIDWQAHYVQLFDNSRSASLYIFEHLKGDSKDRGQAMVDMTGFYREQGLDLSQNELPDYVPVFLEFLSTLDQRKAAEYLSIPINIIQRVYIALSDSNNPYKYILNAVISLSEKAPDHEAVQKMIKAQKPMDFDKEYAEAPVIFGSDNACITCK